MKLKTPVVAGVLFLLLSVAAFAYRHPPFSAVLGIAALAAGAVLLKVGTRKRPVF
jgi:hypothetical protein